MVKASTGVYTKHSFFLLGFRRPNLITGLSGWQAPDLPLNIHNGFADENKVRGRVNITSQFLKKKLQHFGRGGGSGCIE